MPGDPSLERYVLRQYSFRCQEAVSSLCDVALCDVLES